MSSAANPIEIIRIQQSDAAPAKSIRVRLGWRPGVVLVSNYKAAGRLAVAVDGFDAVVGGMFFGHNAATTAVGADGITFFDEGFILGQDAALVRDNDAEILCIAMRSLSPVNVLKVAGAASTVKGFGSGTQFGRKSDGTFDATGAGQLSGVTLTLD